MKQEGHKLVLESAYYSLQTGEAIIKEVKKLQEKKKDNDDKEYQRLLRRRGGI